MMEPFYGHSGSWINEKTHFNGSRIDENIMA